MRKSAISMGGYTWWVKDWQTDHVIFELNLTERGAYRELIDLAMLHDNKVKFTSANAFSRMWGSNVDVVEDTLNRLEELGVIVFSEDGTTISVPSCEKRLSFIRSSRKGGSASPSTKKKGRDGEGMGKVRGSITDNREQSKENREQKTDVVVEKESTTPPKSNSILHYTECSKKLNNERSLDAMINRKEYANTFNDFEDSAAKRNAFRHAMKDFNDHLKSTADEYKELKDYAKHLHSWLRVQQENNRFGLYPWQYYMHSPKNGHRAVDKDKNDIVRKDLKPKRS